VTFATKNQIRRLGFFKIVTYNKFMEKEFNEILLLIEKIGFPIVFCLVFIFRLDAKMQKLIELNYRMMSVLKEREK